MNQPSHGALHHVELWVPDLRRAIASVGWRLMFAERHPHAGGQEHYAAYLENDDCFEVELVATVA